MARLSPLLAHQSNDRLFVDAGFLELSQLLARLQQNVLHASAEREQRLQTSKYERNLKHTRSLLTRLEQGALHIKAQDRRFALQTDLGVYREVLDSLFDRLEDLQQLSLTDEDEFSSDEHSDTQGCPSSVVERVNSEESSELGEDTVIERRTSPTPPPKPVPDPPQYALAARASRNISPSRKAASNLIQNPTSEGVRSRASLSASPSSPYTSARASLFASRRAPSMPQTSTVTAEAILDQQRAEQDALSESILKMAGALKASSQRFSRTLEADQDMLRGATESLEKTENGMSTARGRMGALRKMTEGKGWWGRLLLYAWVYGMMLTLILLVFVLPKLRF